MIKACNIIFGSALIFYVAAFICYCVFAGTQNEKTYKRARIINWIGFALALTGMCLRWYEAGHPPLSNMYESLITLSAFTVLAGLLFTKKERLIILEAGSDVASVVMIGITSLFPSNVRPLVPALESYWLHLHVSLAFLGEACFALAFILSYLYCLKRLDEYKSEKLTATGEQKACKIISVGLPILILLCMVITAWHLTTIPERVFQGHRLFAVTGALAVIFFIFRQAMAKKAGSLLPKSEKLDALTYKAIAMGYPLFTVGGLIFGMIWANKAWGRYWGWDPKETWALVTFMVYSLYLHLRLSKGKSGIITAYISVIGFLVTMFTLFGVNFIISGLHSYA